MPLEPLTPERRRAMTRQYLLEAAAVVFARDGFHGATLDDVASLAGFTKGAVYSNFKSKDDLFLALIDDRIERTYTVISDVVENVAHEASAQLPHIRELLRGGSLYWDETWQALNLEFLLYARRNPAVRAKLAARAEREREIAQLFIQNEHASRGIEPPWPVEELAKVSLALFGGLAHFSLIDPGSVTDTTIETALSLLYEAMDMPEETVGAESTHRKRTRTRTKATRKVVEETKVDDAQSTRRARRR